MKKNYIAPEICEFKLAQTLLAAASQLSTEPQTQNVTVDPNEIISGSFSSRRKSEWDDEDDEY
jgi:hypothetical protein